MTTRRGLMMEAGLAVLASGWLGRVHPGWAASGSSPRLADELARIERESGGRLGVAVLDTLTGKRIGQREHERFPMCSPFKLLAAAAILSRVDAGQESLS